MTVLIRQLKLTAQLFSLYKYLNNICRTKHKVCIYHVLTLTEHFSDYSNILIQYFTSSGHPSGLGSRPLFFKSSIKWNTIICPCLSLPIMRMNSWNRRLTVINNFQRKNYAAMFLPGKICCNNSNNNKNNNREQYVTMIKL